MSLRGYRGRIVILNFWATWCIPCREEMPVLANVRERYAPRGVEIIAVSTDVEGDRDAVARFARDMGLEFPVWVGAGVEDMRAFGLGEALPATAFLDVEGRIAYRIRGPVTRRDLTSRLDALHGGSEGPRPPVLLDRFQAAAHGHSHEGDGGEGREDQGADSEGAHDHEAGGEDPHDHEGGEEHEHGGVGMEGASLVPS